MLAEILYIVVMFALRFAVMNNNALLSRFPAKSVFDPYYSHARDLCLLTLMRGLTLGL